jgi:hypothetical protein
MPKICVYFNKITYVLFIFKTYEELIMDSMKLKEVLQAWIRLLKL